MYIHLQTGPVNCDYIKCGIPGQCIGILEYQQTAQSQTDCEASSKKGLNITCFVTLILHQADAIAYGDSAMWYTYDKANLLCLLFSECQEFSDALCEDCVSGQPACIIEEGLMPTAGMCHFGPNYLFIPLRE